MKSRVQRNKELHDKINKSVDDNLETSDLSELANRLNMIDEQFEPMEYKDTHEPKRAKTETIPIFDTFDNVYLKDFLDEVKSYNVTRSTSTQDYKKESLTQDVPSTSSDEVSAWEAYLLEKERAEKPVTLETVEPVEDRDIKSEFLELADEIETEQRTGDTLPLEATDIEEQTFDVIRDEEVVEHESDPLLNTEELKEIDEIQNTISYVHVDSVEEPTEDKKKKKKKQGRSNLVNGLISVLLLGVVLAGALAIKFLFFK